jgi:hypothetical protein
MVWLDALGRTVRWPGAATERRTSEEEKRTVVSYSLVTSDLEFDSWLSQSPSEDDLRTAYLALEARRADLWTAGHIDSFRRDRYELDSRYVRRLVRIKRALADLWTASGQIITAEAQPA